MGEARLRLGDVAAVGLLRGGGLGFALEERRLRVVLYRAEDFTRLTGLGHWAGGVFDGTIRVPIGAEGVDPRLDGVLRHELSHAFVERLGGGACPAWLKEGLAQILEERRFDRRRAEVARAALRTAPRLALADLERPFVGLANYAEAVAEPRFWQALAHTAFFAITSVALELLLGLLLALGLHELRFGRGPARTAWVQNERQPTG